MNALTILWVAAVIAGVAAGVSILQTRLERWEQRRHAED
jgi:hypothetical protein